MTDPKRIEEMAKAMARSIYNIDYSELSPAPQSVCDRSARAAIEADEAWRAIQEPPLFIVTSHGLGEPLEIKPGEIQRVPGRSKLVYDKAKRTIVRVDPQAEPHPIAAKPREPDPFSKIAKLDQQTCTAGPGAKA